MALVCMSKMPFKTKHFNKNQKVWVISHTGAMAANVCGKFRGKGRYVSAWVNWDRGDREKYPFPKFIDFDVSDSFALRHGLLIKSK